MCEPSTIMLGASLAASALGSVMQSQAAEQQASARKSALNRYQDRLDGLQNQANTLITDTTGKFDRDRRIAELDTMKDDAIRQVSGSVTPTSDLGGEALGKTSSSRVVKEAYEQGAQDAGAEAQRQAARVGNLAAWSNNRFLKDVDLTRAGSKIAELDNYAKGWQPVYQAELQAAQSKGGGLNVLGEVFKGLGTVGSIGAGMMGSGALGSLFSKAPTGTASMGLSSGSGFTGSMVGSGTGTGGGFVMPFGPSGL